MPRNYKCRKCGIVRPPPTGKHCREHLHVKEEIPPEQALSDDGDPVPADNTNNPSMEEIIPLLMDLKQQIAEMKSSATNDGSASAGSIVSNREIANMADIHGPPDDLQIESLPNDITPNTLRQNTPVMRQATARLSRVRWQDDDANGECSRHKSAGKKSGSMLTAAELVEERIDWPHMYVTRLTGGRRKGVNYAELTSEEFAYGFIAMIGTPHCNWDYRTMNEILGIIMQHAMQFGWESARALYQELGVEVEKDRMLWSDSDSIRDIRFNHSHHKPTERKEPQDNTRPPLKLAPAGTKACVAYQTRACEQLRDHPPYTHTCAYCLKACNALCRHTESDCIRRVTDAAKNSKKRE